MSPSNILNRRIHIEGMGLTGSLLIRRLMDFYPTVTEFRKHVTWHDNDSKQTAWRASTGAIYPAGSHKFGPDMECWKVWAGWHRQGFYSGCLEESSYWFGHKKPPHQGKYKIIDSRYHMQRGELNSYHINAQKLVPETQEMFDELRFPAEAERADILIRAHGWGRRLSRAYWGWTRLVELDYDPLTFGDQLRPCVYFRPNKVQMAYAYPVPGTPYWYAGSSIIAQPLDKFRSLEMPPKYERWKELFERLTMGAITVKREADFIEGWRPAADPGDTSWVMREWNGKQLILTMRPLWNSGIRHFPKQLASLYGALDLFDMNLKELYQ